MTSLLRSRVGAVITSTIEPSEYPCCTTNAHSWIFPDSPICTFARFDRRPDVMHGLPPGHQRTKAGRGIVPYRAEAIAALAGVVDYMSTLQKVANLAVPYFATGRQ